MKKCKEFHPIQNRMEFHQMQTLHIDENPYAFAFLRLKFSQSKKYYDGSVARLVDRLIDEASDVPSIIFIS